MLLPGNLLREARRQRGLADGCVPPLCLLDPDGDVARHALAALGGRVSPVWACYHTTMVETEAAGIPLGIVGCAVGAPFAVLVAEQLFASGCRVLVSVTSAGRIGDGAGAPPVVLIARSLRGEGTSIAYLPPSDGIDADPATVAAVAAELDARGLPARPGTAWTTDAPYRETATALARAAAAGAEVVEMESAALTAFSRSRGVPVVCFAHVTNAMAVDDGPDFEKGPASGAEQALALAAAAGAALGLRQGPDGRPPGPERRMS